MGKAAVLQPGLVGGDEHPTVAGAEQAAAFGAERLTLFRIRDLRQVRLEMLGAAVRRADVDDAAMDAAVGADVLAPGLLAGGQLTPAGARAAMYSARPANSG